MACEISALEATLDGGRSWFRIEGEDFSAVLRDWRLTASQIAATWEALARGDVVKSRTAPGFAYRLEGGRASSRASRGVFRSDVREDPSVNGYAPTRRQIRPLAGPHGR
jgi:hypothetical protein